MLNIGPLLFTATGTAMGSPVTPSFTNIFLTNIEDYVILTSPLSRHIKMCLRYVDDVFMPWSGPHVELEQFELYLNDIDIESDHEICYLDVKITLAGGRLDTALFLKKTNNLLRRNSAHAPQTFKGITRSQFIRA